MKPKVFLEGKSDIATTTDCKIKKKKRQRM